MLCSEESFFIAGGERIGRGANIRCLGANWPRPSLV